MGGDGSEFEMIKEVLLDTNIYLLATTVVVSVFHMIFEMLAFKSDISHYRNKKNNVGISVRSILGNVFMQAVIFLYLLDNNDNTSKVPAPLTKHTLTKPGWMILFSQGMGIVLEFWKITTVVNLQILSNSITFASRHVSPHTGHANHKFVTVLTKLFYPAACPFRAFSLPLSTLFAVAPAPVCAECSVVRHQPWIDT